MQYIAINYRISHFHFDSSHSQSLLRTKNRVSFYDIAAKSIQTGIIASFGDQNSLERVKQVLLNRQIALNDAKLPSNDSSAYIDKLESRIKILEAENGDLKTKLDTMTRRSAALTTILEAVEEAKKGIKDCDVKITVIIF